MLNQDETRILAEKMLAFFIRFSHWKTQVYDQKFNINGKGKNTPELTVRQFGILFLIHHYKLKTVSELVQEINISKSSISLMVTKLTDEGYLRKKAPRKGDDGRKVYIELTAKGKRALEELTNNIFLVFDSFYNSLAEDRKGDFITAIESFDAVFKPVDRP